MRIPLFNLTTGIIAAFLGTTAAPVLAQAPPQYRPLSLQAQQAPDGSNNGQLGTKIRNGTVLSMSPAHMSIQCRENGKAFQLELELSGDTVRKGEISVGSPVTVHYRVSNNRNLATSIQLRRSQPPIKWEPAE